uniref:Agenet domain-containing protein n=1 Tax=Pseudo-nitzschia australis TaxID=44445 RepID=A0A7S4EIH5_9STRA
MPSSFLPLTISQIYTKALFDPRPTETVISQKQLAYALGYPMDWRVERTIIIEETDDTKTKIIKDRIHALGGKKNQTKYMWLHHEAAQKAALLFEKEGTLDPSAVEGSSNTNNNNTNNSNTNTNTTTGSHLLPATALFKKGDIVMVKYEDKWWSATVTKKPKKKNDDEFLYSVFYHGDDATQDEIAEEDLKPGEDPSELAVSLGLGANWTATRNGSRFVIVAPCGTVFQSKAAATKHFKDLARKALKASGGATATNKNSKKRKAKEEDAGDPPWRREGHDWIGKKVLWTFQHKASARRQITIEQTGTIEGYIDESDTDKDGNPGFVSEKTGKPANLFHVVFDENPGHPYTQYLLKNTDVEGYEISDRILPEEIPKTKTTSSSSGGGHGDGDGPSSSSKSAKKRRRR